MPTLMLAERRLHYRDAGAGVPLLLLHGFPLHSESFWPQLESPPEGVRLLAPDHRGFGASAAGLEPLSMDAMAEDALGLLDALDLREALVGGVSMGGYVAMALLRCAPQRVRGLLLVGTQARSDDDAGRERREATARSAEAEGIDPVAQAMLPKLLSPNAPTSSQARLAAIVRSISGAAAAAGSRAMALRPDSLPTLAAFRGPACIVHGADDALIPLERGHEMAGLIEGSEWVALPGAGHLAQIEEADACGAAIARLAERVRATGGWA